MNTQDESPSQAVPPVRSGGTREWRAVAGQYEWKIVQDDRSCPSDPWAVATVYPFCGSADESAEANARLIAAAPDMLAALQDVFALMDEGWLVRNTSEDHKPSFAMRQLSFVQRLAKANAAIAKATGAAS